MSRKRRSPAAAQQPQPVLERGSIGVIGAFIANDLKNLGSSSSSSSAVLGGEEKPKQGVGAG